MDKYVVRQPIKDMEKNVFGYEILFQRDSGGSYNQSNDQAAADTISDFLLQNNDKLFDNKMAFVTFTPNLLFKNTPQIFQQNKLIIQIEDNVIIHPLAQPIIQRFKKQGYRIAINDFQFAPRYFSLMDYLDYIKLNFNGASESSLANLIKMGKGFNKKCIACGIDDKETYDLAVKLDVDYMQGVYIADQVTSKAHRMEYLQSNFFQLVVEITKDEPDLDIIEEIISRDVSLTFSLLKLVNSVYFALRHRTSSIKNALVILGLGQLKQWIYLLSFKHDEDYQEELIKVSFLRANFCSELLPHAVDMPISKSEAYLMGMFSTIDYLVDAPLEEVLQEIPISEDIKIALTTHEGRCGLLYQLILSYERADWKNITKFAEELGIPQSNISQIYFECVDTVNGIWSTLMNPSDELEMESQKGNSLQI